MGTLKMDPENRGIQIMNLASMYDWDMGDGCGSHHPSIFWGNKRLDPTALHRFSAKSV